MDYRNGFVIDALVASGFFLSFFGFQRIRRHLLLSSFFLVTCLVYFLVPFFRYYFVDGLDYEKAVLVFSLYLSFISGFFFTPFLFRTGHDSIPVSRLLKVFSFKAVCVLTLCSVGLKLVSGNFGHSTVVDLGWSFPWLFGLSDRCFMLAAFLLVVFGVFRPQAKVFIVLVFFILFSFFTGSRVASLLPLFFSAVLCLSFEKISKSIVMVLFSLLFLAFAIIGIVGALRMDDPLEFEFLVHAFFWRISDFEWPLAVIAEYPNIIRYDPSWFFSTFLAVFPPSFLELFGLDNPLLRDTQLMEQIDIGKSYMSVPLTFIGELYLWGGAFLVFFGGVFSGWVFLLMSKFLGNSKSAVFSLTLLQLISTSLMLQLNGVAEFVAMFSKGFLVALLTSVLLLSLPSFVRAVFKYPNAARGLAKG